MLMMDMDIRQKNFFFGVYHSWPVCKLCVFMFLCVPHLSPYIHWALLCSSPVSLHSLGTEQYI